MSWQHASGIATVRPAERRIRPSNRANSGMRSLVSSVPSHRRKRKIRRTGQHTTPSPVEKVAQTAGKAAPAVVVVGTLAAAAPHVGGVTAAGPAATAPHVIHAHLDDMARGKDMHFSLRYALLHMIEETSRHCGHLDLLRERIDGSTGQ